MPAPHDHFVPTHVLTTNLQMLAEPLEPPRPLPDGARLDLASGITPEYARFLYALVGGPWRWVDQLRWSREQWADDLAKAGTEFWVLYVDGVPGGYAHLQASPVEGGTHVEFRYFGLAPSFIGRGLGGVLLGQAIGKAWSLAERHGLAAVTRVWLHTCSLDSPTALSNYRSRGFIPYETSEDYELMPQEPLGSWASSGGSA